MVKMDPYLKQNIRFYRYWEQTRANHEFQPKTAVKPNDILYYYAIYPEILPLLNSWYQHNQHQQIIGYDLSPNGSFFLFPSGVSGPHSKLWNYKDKIYLIEDGFIRGLFSYFSQKINGLTIPYTAQMRLSCSIDDISPHFNIYNRSRLEILLNNSELSEQQKQRASKLRQLIVDNCITKYNYQPIIQPEIGDPNKKKILILDQSKGDQSILMSGGLGQFDLMLESAVNENPNCDIIIKVHPDALGGSDRNSCFDLADIQSKYDNVILYAQAINPVSLLQYVDKVYTCSSGMGFEALLAGKEVITFACPFYAGWGLSDDRHPLMQSEIIKKRRQKRLSVEDILYQTYINYCHYTHPEYHIEMQVEDAIAYLIKHRHEFFANPEQYVEKYKFNNGLPE